MWIIPKHSPTFLSVRVTEGLTSDSNAFCRDCAQSLTLNGKHSRQQIWSQKLKRENWLQLLFTRTLSPSHTKTFTDWWRSCLGDFRANPSARRDSNEPARTSATSSPLSLTESTSADQQSFSLKTSLDSCAPVTGPALLSMMSSLSLSALATLQLSECSLRMKSARLTNANASSSWPTPTATQAKQSRTVSSPSLLDRALMEEFGLPNPAKDPESVKYLALLRRRYELNPEWLEALMGIPRGWTAPE